MKEYRMKNREKLKEKERVRSARRRSWNKSLPVQPLAVPETATAKAHTCQVKDCMAKATQREISGLKVFLCEDHRNVKI